MKKYFRLFFNSKKDAQDFMFSISDSKYCSDKNDFISISNATFMSGLDFEIERFGQCLSVETHLTELEFKTKYVTIS